MGTSFLYLEKIEIQKAVQKIVFVRDGIVSKDLYHCESSSIESICIELTISKRKCCIFFEHSPKNFNKREIFKEISSAVSKPLKCYDNIIIARYLNINLLDPSKDTSNRLFDLLDVFNLLRNLLVSCLTKGL